MIWLLLSVYVAFMAFMYVFQRSFTFHPSAENPFEVNNAPFEVLPYQTPMGMNLRGLYVLPKPGKPMIVYFHGNAGQLGDRFFKAKEFLPHGYGMALVGYRGYSGNPGQPSEQGFYEDGRAAIKTLQKIGVREEDMVFYGESLGSGVATQMATEFPKAKALILEAPFTSAVAVAKRAYWFLPVRLLMKDTFDNDKKIGSLTMPVMIIHGTDDRTVPYHFGEELFKQVKSPVKEFITLKGAGHADVYNFDAGKFINAFLEKL